jgi:hypothetical protein
VWFGVGVAFVGAATLGSTLEAQAHPASLVGAWRVVRFCDRDSSGAMVEPLGPNPTGLFVYTATGQLSIQAMRTPPSGPLAGEPVHLGSLGELRPFYFGYFGTYSILSDTTVIHHVQGGTLPDYIGTDQPRRYSIRNDTLSIGAPALPCRVLIRATSPHQPQSLFNGKDLTGWHVDVPAADSNARLRSPFLVRNGVLVSLGEPRGHLLTDSSYRDYRLEIEYRFAAAPGNAGVLVHASTPRALYGMFPRSIEVQMEHGNAGDFWCILEDIHVPDMERRRGPASQWGTTEGKARRIRNLTDDSEQPVGEWNTMVIEAVGGSIRVWVNGALVNDGSDATADRGRIALQAEGSEVEFRKLLLTPISKLTITR